MANPLQAELLDLITDDTQAGFRLARLEVYNWGTFNQHVWQIQPNGKNALLTGDIGSGKSTLVDAVTTLLVPHHRITYNKAAGAENKERSLYSYIRGEYKNEQDDFTQAAKTIPLREEHHYTVLLAYFYNKDLMQGVTLAQVFWLKDNKRNPERFFVVAQQELSIAQHFCGFDEDILHLKKQLRQQLKNEIFDQFKEYSHHFRQLFGIHNEQALELFYQTVSIKSVGNFTEFVRQHMLEKCDIESRVAELRQNFENLNRAHEAVLKAKQQIEQLKPLVADLSEYKNLSETIKELRDSRDALYTYFARMQITLLKEKIEQLTTDIAREQQKLTSHKQEIQALYSQEIAIRNNINQNGGERLHALEIDILRLSEEQARKQKTERHYSELIKKLGFPALTDENSFYQHQQNTRAILTNIDETKNTLQLKQVDLRVDIKALQMQGKNIENELHSLRKRQSNIPDQMLLLRQSIAEALNIDEKKLPFAGELLQVNENATEWEGAIERVLHHFGLSLLVPESYYAEVNRFVERTHLKNRLVYYRVQTTQNTPKTHKAEPASLFNKLHIQPQSEFYHWLEEELLNRFNYICCEELDEFRRLPQAITRQGLIKSKGQRHEKDDRHPLKDRSRYILGWSNQQKIQALSELQLDLQQRGDTLVKELALLAKQLDENLIRRDVCRDVLAVSQPGDIDWQSVTLKIQVLLQEEQELEKSSDLLKTLKVQLEKTQQSIRQKTEDQTQLERGLGGKEQQLQDRTAKLVDVQVIADQVFDVALLEQLDSFKEKMLSANQADAITLQNVDKCQTDTRSLIQRHIDNADGRYKNLIGHITKQMQMYKNQFPADTVEIDANPDAGKEYVRMLDVLQKDDLPRHSARFKTLLNEGTINSVALFQNQLMREKQDIEGRITKINRSLVGIEYNAGTYIKLLIDATQDIEVREFQQDLRRCLQNTLNDRDFYDEDKFLQVKAILDRFNGREGKVDIDRRWMQKVCDVRNWFNFFASERWLEDHTEKEFFSDSSGKSGGQKEKLAYTILASALAYQFGLEEGVTHSRSFRFVVIDEAFGKGSNESTRYALELFNKLNLQLLIVTPLQKIHVIENYIRSIHFVDNQEGSQSVIRNLTIEEYQQEKLRRIEVPHDNALAG